MKTKQRDVKYKDHTIRETDSILVGYWIDRPNGDTLGGSGTVAGCKRMIDQDLREKACPQHVPVTKIDPNFPNRTKRNRQECEACGKWMGYTK